MKTGRRRKQSVAIGLASYLAAHALSASATTETATWVSGIVYNNNSWIEPSNWSTNPNYPNNGSQAGVDYQVVIGLSPTGGPAQVSLGSTVSVDSITLDASGGSLQLEGGTLTAPSINLNGGGSFAVDGSGMLVGADVSVSGGDFYASSPGSVNDVEFSGGDLVGSYQYQNIDVFNGVTVDD